MPRCLILASMSSSLSFSTTRWTLAFWMERTACWNALTLSRCSWSLPATHALVGSSSPPRALDPSRSRAPARAPACARARVREADRPWARAARLPLDVAACSSEWDPYARPSAGDRAAASASWVSASVEVAPVASSCIAGSRGAGTPSPAAMARKCWPSCSSSSPGAASPLPASSSSWSSSFSTATVSPVGVGQLEPNTMACSSALTLYAMTVGLVLQVACQSEMLSLSATVGSHPSKRNLVVSLSRLLRLDVLDSELLEPEAPMDGGTPDAPAAPARKPAMLCTLGGVTVVVSSVVSPVRVSLRW
mmetsp:Transcript_6262/g.26024  ORF Transcript_6262/g.26024 Transcript_6262/m.26024 type:complete len:306 (-) Transcript_6262:1017-1934(-)